MFNFFKNKIMAISEIFKDTNDYNEKTIIGFISFGIMVIAMIVDVITGTFGKGLVINEFMYNSFLIITLGSFGIAGIEKIANRGSSNSSPKIPEKEVPPSYIPNHKYHREQHYKCNDETPLQ